MREGVRGLPVREAFAKGSRARGFDVLAELFARFPNADFASASEDGRALL
jgi:hypothetical protein